MSFCFLPERLYCENCPYNCHENRSKNRSHEQASIGQSESSFMLPQTAGNVGATVLSRESLASHHLRVSRLFKNDDHWTALIKNKMFVFWMYRILWTWWIPTLIKDYQLTFWCSLYLVLHYSCWERWVFRYSNRESFKIKMWFNDGWLKF